MTAEEMALVAELTEALDDPKRGEWGGYPWEHLGDAERDVRTLLATITALVAQAETARERAHHAERERDAALVMLNQHKLRETHRAELVAEAAVEGFAIIETMADGTVFTGQESREALAHALGLISGTALSRRERVAALAGGDSR